MIELGAEEKLLFLASRLNVDDNEIGSLKELVSSNGIEIQYPILIKMAIDHGVAPLLYKNIKKVDRIPDNVIKKLKSIYLEATSLNLKKSHETLRIISALKKNNIAAIPLKGAIASEVIFKNPALYYGTDIDILVKPPDLEQSKYTLINLGYQYNEKSESDLLSFHYHLVLFNDQQFVELHWNLVKKYFKISPDFWWEKTSCIKHMGHEIICLEPEKYLIYLIFRLHSHMFYPLKFFVLISEMCNKHYKEINWDYFIQLAKKFRMKKLAIFSLKFVNDNLGAHVDKTIVKKNILGYNIFVQSIMNMLFKDIKRPYLRKIVHMLLLDSQYQIFISLLKRIFPGKSELRLRYGISKGSKLIYLYYILNPVLLPLLLFRKKRIQHTNNSF